MALHGAAISLLSAFFILHSASAFSKYGARENEVVTAMSGKSQENTIQKGEKKELEMLDGSEPTTAAQESTTPSQEEIESDKIEKECEQEMKEKIKALSGDEATKHELEKDCFFECVFKKNKVADEKGNVIEKTVVQFFLSNSQFKDKDKLKKMAAECVKKAKDNGKIKEIGECNPFSSYVYHCVYEDMHMQPDGVRECQVTIHGNNIAHVMSTRLHSCWIIPTS